MFGIGAGEFVLILIVGLIVFGPSKLPEFGRSLGKLLREFRKAQAALSTTINDLDEPAKPAAAPSTPHAAPSTSSVAPSTSTTPSTSLQLRLQRHLQLQLLQLQQSKQIQSPQRPYRTLQRLRTLPLLNSPR